MEAHKVLFFGQFLDLLLNLTRTDLYLKRKFRTPSSFSVNILSTHLVKYLGDLYHIFSQKSHI